MTLSKAGEATLARTPSIRDDLSSRNDDAPSLAPAFPGVPRRRGPRGLMAQLRAQLVRPEMRVWLRPVGRTLGMGVLLSCVAFLGSRAQAEEAYGPEIPLEAPPQAPGALSAPLAAVAKPQREEAAPPNGASVSQVPCVKREEEARAKGVTDDGRVILNEATTEEFTRLSGIGRSRAEAIVKLRTRLHGFKKVTDLLRVKGIGWKTLQRLKAQVVLNRPSPESSASGSATD